MKKYTLIDLKDVKL